MSEAKSDSVRVTKHQRFEVVRMRRSEIQEATYNPRTITEQNRKKLRKKISAVGLLEPVVVNRRTGTLVSGHKRLAILDGLERGRDYALDVSVVDLDERQEREMNVFFNNTSAMGEYDLDLLADLHLEAGIDFEAMGFEEYDIDVLFDGDARFSNFFPDPEEVGEVKEGLEKVKAARAESVERLRERNQAQFYFVVVCRDDDQRAELLRLIGVPVFEQFVEGEYLRENLVHGLKGRRPGEG